MGHKTHPIGFRLGITQEHKSEWYSKLNTYSDYVKEDFIIRNVVEDYLKREQARLTRMKKSTSNENKKSESNELKKLRISELKKINPNELKKLRPSGLKKIVIRRTTNNKQINVEILTALPGVVVGEIGTGLEFMDQQFVKLFPNKKILMNVIQVNDVYQEADLVAEMLVDQLEKRVPFRRAMKSIIEQTQQQPKIQGIKVQVAGRLNGAEIARTEWLREGRVPLQTMRADIDFSYKTANTIYGILGIKIWLFKGDQILNT